MNKKEFEANIKDKNINLRAIDLVVGEITNIPYVTGCFEEDRIWKIYKIGERQDFSVVMEGTEEEIFTFMNDIAEDRYEDYLKGIYK